MRRPAGSCSGRCRSSSKRAGEAAARTSVRHLRRSEGAGADANRNPGSSNGHRTSSSGNSNSSHRNSSNNSNSSHSNRNNHVRVVDAGAGADVARVVEHLPTRRPRSPQRSAVRQRKLLLVPRVVAAVASADIDSAGAADRVAAAGRAAAIRRSLLSSPEPSVLESGNRYQIAPAIGGERKARRRRHRRDHVEEAQRSESPSRASEMGSISRFQDTSRN